MNIVQIIQNTFIRRVVTLQAGSFFGNALQALAGVIIARILQPELYGRYVLAFGLASLVSIVLGAGIQEAVVSLLGRAMARKDKTEVTEILAFFFKMSIILGGIGLLALVIMPPLAQHWYGDATLGWYAMFVVLGAILSMVFFSLAQVGAQVTGRIHILTGLGIADQALRFGISVLLVISGAGILGAMAGQLIGMLIITPIAIMVWQRIAHLDQLVPSMQELFHTVKNVHLKKYLSFSLWIALDRNIGTLFMTIPLVVTGIYVAAQDVTFFRLAFSYMNLALSLLGAVSILLNVEFPKISVESPTSLRKHFLTASLASMGFSVLLAAGAAIVSPIAFKLLYGESFLPSIPYVYAFIPYAMLFGIGAGLGPMWRALNKVKVSILINIITLGTIIPLGMYLIPAWGLKGAVAFTTLLFIVPHFVSFFYLSNALKNIAKNRNSDTIK